MKKHRMLVDGSWVEAASGEWFESINPFTAQAWALIPRGAKADVDRAVTAAKKAFYSKEWRGLTASARGALLRKLADLLVVEADRLAELETTDNGKLLVGNARAASLRAEMVSLLRRPGRQDRRPGACRQTDRDSSTLRAKNLLASSLRLHRGIRRCCSRLEARACAGCRKHCRAQAFGTLFSLRARVWRTLREGRIPTRSRQHPYRFRQRSG